MTRIGEVRNKDQLLDALKASVNERQEKRRPYEAIWWNNIALVAGDHYTRFDPTMAVFADKDPTFSDTKDKKPRMVINQALSVFRTELAKLTKNHPVIEVMANSDEQEDLAATKVGKAVLSAFEWKFRLPQNRKEILSWVIQTGIGAHYVGWDHLNSDSGEFEFVIDPATGEPAFSAERQREIKEEAQKNNEEPVIERYPLGDVDFKVYGPFQLLPDPVATNFWQLRDLITTEVADLDVVRDVYGRPADSLNPQQVSIGPMEQRILARVGLAHPRAQQSDNGVEVFTFWLIPNVFRRNKFLQNGLYVRWCQDKILEFSEFPYQDARMPFAFYQHIPAPTSIWPDCVVNHIRELNLEIDKTISQLVANKDYMSNPMWRVASQHRIKGEIKNVAGSVLKYVHSQNIPPPEPIQGLQMPSQVENLVELMRTQILEISGQSDISRGSVPTGVRSGTAVAYLQEEDDSKIAPTIDNLEQAIAFEGSLILERVSQYYHTRRIMRFYRRDGEFDVVRFKGADLKNNTDVITQAGSAMPRSKAAREQYILQLVELGVITDPRKIEDMLELGEAEPNLEDLQIAMANRENNLMLEGQSMATYDVRGDIAPNQNAPVAIPVFKWHNHKVHLDRHYSFMSGEEFDRIRVSHPEIGRLFDEHTAMHEQQLAAQNQEQMAMLEAAKGAPDGQPAGTPPRSSITSPPQGAPGGGAQGLAVADQATTPQAGQTNGSGQITNS